MPETVTSTQRANANPSKSFFISMLTRDIDLVDCILDLLDNSVDGITENARRNGQKLDPNLPFKDHIIKLDFDGTHFSIRDRSGGIPVSVATEYAFRFGRPDDAPKLNDGTIGLYGIGMKRAIFKIGNLVRLESATQTEAFSLDLNVQEWQASPETQHDVHSWAFDIAIHQPIAFGPPGTFIEITELYDGIKRQFESPAFHDKVRRSISNDYAFILNLGLQVEVNGVTVQPTLPKHKRGAELAPFEYVETIDGVTIEIVAGLAESPPDDSSSTSRITHADAYGWYVVCNNRVVVTADKSRETGWGQKPLASWHPQYSGFVGVVRFTSNDPSKLPWKTTKRDVESSNVFFLHALPTMIRATKRFTDYTNQRKSELKRVKKIEKASVAVPIQKVQQNSPGKLPKVSNKDIIVIQYEREKEDVEAVADALGLISPSPTEVGIRTFEYFFSREVRK